MSILLLFSSSVFAGVTHLPVDNHTRDALPGISKSPVNFVLNFPGEWNPETIRIAGDYLKTQQLGVYGLLTATTGRSHHRIGHGFIAGLNLELQKSIRIKDRPSLYLFIGYDFNASVDLVGAVERNSGGYGGAKFKIGKNFKCGPMVTYLSRNEKDHLEPGNMWGFGVSADIHFGKLCLNTNISTAEQTLGIGVFFGDKNK